MIDGAMVGELVYLIDQRTHLAITDNVGLVVKVHDNGICTVRWQKNDGFSQWTWPDYLISVSEWQDYLREEEICEAELEEMELEARVK
jgi:hypothetical protein